MPDLLAPKRHANSTYRHGQDTNRRTRDRYLPPAGDASRTRAKGRRRSWAGLRAVRRGSLGGLLLLAPAAADGGGARAGPQGPESLARELLLLATRLALSAADLERGTRPDAEECRAEEVE